MPEILETKCLAIVRGNNQSSVITALCDLVRHARLNFAGTPKVCDPVFADNVLVQVMNEPLIARCGAAAVVQLEDEPGRAIYMIRKIRAPAHVVIVSPQHDIYDGLLKNIDLLTDLGFIMPDDGEDKGGSS